MRKVLHVIGPLSTGGAQTQLLGLIRAAHGRYWDATVVGTSGGPLVRDFESLGCGFVELRRVASPGLVRVVRTRSLAKRGGFDVVHGNLWQSNAYSRVAALGRRPRRPAVVISERNVEPSRSTIRLAIDRGLASVTDAYVGNTDAVTQFIRRVHPVHEDQQVLTITNGVDRTTFRPVLRDRPSSDVVRIGSIGRLDFEKGMDVLVDATRTLSSTRNVEIEIAGDGPLLGELKKRSAGLPVRFIGRVDAGAPVADFLRSLDVFVLPSRFREGRPNVILEAVACGVPVVATSIEGIEEILDRDVLAEPDDPAALAAAIVTAASDPSDWVRRSRPAPIKDFDDLAREYLAVFEAAIERSSRATGRSG